jgi:DNA-binding NarL/FixJ family response regulator
MRLILVGTPPQRSRLRADLDPSAEVVGEFETIADAQAASIPSDGILLASSGTPRPAAQEDDWVAEPLTPREIEVLELLAEGLPNKSIAVRLGISDQTVKFHVASISGKLGATNRTDAVRRALRRGLITL